MIASLTLPPRPSEELGYHPFWEDTPMTLQVALVGTDGIVLASDRKTVISGNVNQSSDRSKILFDPGQEIAIAHSHCEISKKVARLILSSNAPMKERLSAQKLRSFASEAWDQEAWKSLDMHGELIIVSKADLGQILYVNLKPFVSANTLVLDADREVTRDKICAGDSLNSAIFFSERYHEQKPIAELVFLAAHVIRSGHRLNSGGIDGLEVVKCTSKGFDRLSESSIQELIKRSDGLDKRIKRAIFTPPLLTWEPAPT